MRNSIECAYSIEGSGAPLFLIHGIGAARDAWRYMLPTLSQHFTVISYDLRGHGESPVPEAEFTLDDLVADLELLRAKTGFEQAHFAGHSLGGMIGPAYARSFPERVLSVGLLSTAAGRSDADSEKVFAVIKAMQQQGIENVLQTLVDRWFTDDFIEHNPQVIQRRLKQVVDTDAQVFINVFRIYASTEMLPWLGEIRHPCLVLTGANDGGCNPRLNTLISNSLPQAELVILPNVKHSILLEAPAQVCQHMIDFIEQSV